MTVCCEAVAYGRLS